MTIYYNPNGPDSINIEPPLTPPVGWVTVITPEIKKTRELPRMVALANLEAENRVDAYLGTDVRQKMLNMMTAIGILNRARKGQPRPQDETTMTSLENLEAVVESIYAKRDALIQIISDAADPTTIDVTLEQYWS